MMSNTEQISSSMEVPVENFDIADIKKENLDEYDEIDCLNVIKEGTFENNLINNEDFVSYVKIETISEEYIKEEIAETFDGVNEDNSISTFCKVKIYAYYKYNFFVYTYFFFYVPKWRNED